MTRRSERIEYDEAYEELRRRLRRWDPIGVFQDEDPELHAPDDEYNCLIPGLYSRLRAGGREDELVAFLANELIGHFGLSPRPAADREFATELVSWWATRQASH